ncbi:hypothetical protein EDB83DRAFT_2332291 [Lactarius deliciosus]|nr:hypothetical protein EDB83DRAFT_2332291 [Lactarius deliciosus]
MSDEPHLPGYSLEDDLQPRHSPPIQSLTAEPDDTQEPVQNASDTVVATATTPPPIAQPQSLTQQQSFTTQPAPEERPAVDEFADPKIAPLHAIFPDFDAAILYSVVDSVDGDQDRAVDALLSMSDPDHVPSSAGAPAQPPATTQNQLDEEFARQLMLEDEQRYARDQIARQQQQQQQQQLRQFPYAQRTTTAGTPQQQPRSGSPPSPPSQRERDTMTDVQEQFNKLAESGKRTFSTLVSKVKAKVQEFDQSRNAQNPSPPGAGSAPQQQPHASSGLDRHAQQAYYAPRLQPSPRGEDPTLSSSGSGAPAPHTATDDPTAVPAPPATNTGRPPLSNAIDPGKIGLLPKRPVSLVDTQSQSQQQFQDHQSPSHPPDDSDEELEYVENPFEEERHS